MQQARASGQRHGKYVGLRRLAQAVVGRATHRQWGQQPGKAEVIWHRQVVFCLWKLHRITSAQTHFEP